jgi:hypothetical protein
MTNELLALAGRATDNPLKGLTFRDLIEFAERFGVGVEEINALPASERWRALAWLLWKAKSKQGYTKSFDEFLDEEGVVDELLQMSSAVPLAATSQSDQA